MKFPNSAQAWVHWLEAGGGRSLTLLAASFLGAAVLSLLVSYKQFRGPGSETAFLQLDLARQIGEGRGFVTRVNYPRTAAFLEARDASPSAGQPFPELTQAPLYALAVAPAVMAAPGPTAEPAPAPTGFAADYAVLALNVFFLWLAAVQTWWLGRRWFDAKVGAIAAAALLLSTPVWQDALSLGGTPVAMVLLLGLAQTLTGFESSLDRGGRIWPWLAGAGAVCGLLALCDYPAAILAPLVAAFAGWRCRRFGAAAALILAAAAVVTPWIVRNMAWTGNPVALAAGDIALRVGDPTADPELHRREWTAQGPKIELRKVANKGLTVVQSILAGEIWSRGGLVLSALFLVSWLYRFRSAPARRLRALFTIGLFAWTVAFGICGSGEAERHPLAIGAPLFMIFGAGFFSVLVSGSSWLSPRIGWATAALLALQAAPLLQDLVEPRKVHFRYPPYHPALFASIGSELVRRSRGDPVWMSDIPAGAAWYTGTRVWAQTRSLREFYALSVDQPFAALLLSPRILDRPYFSELAQGTAADDESRFGGWNRIYAGLATGQLPAEFPLARVQKLSANYIVLIDPNLQPVSGN